jgi:2-polyprenyl-6-methoxyphenol hydroxylase-like FAD-dependent oxidoreductase
MNDNAQKRAIIIGASYAGLVAAAGLKCHGWTVRVLEKSTERSRSGGGVVVQRRMLEYLERHGVAFPGVASIPARTRRIFRQDGQVMEMPETAAAYTSWDVLLKELEEVVGSEHIERGLAMTDIPDWGAPGIVELNDGTTDQADIVVAADGIGSLARRLLLPGISPTYAGYIAWRGMVEEKVLTEKTVQAFCDTLSSFQGKETTILLYEVPGEEGSLEKGERRINWVWYENMPAGPRLSALMTDTAGYEHRSTVGRSLMTPETRRYMEQRAEEELPPSFREVVLSTPEPFVQKIEDLTIPRLVFGKVVLIGDAASLARPHIGSGTAKAVDDAIHLATAMSKPCDPELLCLAAWEHTRLNDHYGLADYAKAIAHRLGLGT